MSRSIRTLCLTVAGAATLATLPAAAQTTNTTGAVFVMTNNANANQVIAYTRAADGVLSNRTNYNTGGLGSGGNVAPLGSQGSLRLSQDGTLLFAVNAGSGDLSVFRVSGVSLSLVDRVPTSGSSPVAVAQRGDLLFVLDAGGQGSVFGYRILGNGTIKGIQNSGAYLTQFGGGSGGSSIAISPDGQFLLVTERIAGNVDAFPINPNGSLGAEVVTPSAGANGFSGIFTSTGYAIVSELGTASGSTISSYSLGADGRYTPITTALPAQGQGSCWNVLTPNGRYVYVSNTATSTISGFSVSQTGVLSPIGSTVVGLNPAGSRNLDIAVTSDGRYLYTIDSVGGAIARFYIQDDGFLTRLGETEGLPHGAGFEGIAAY